MRGDTVCSRLKRYRGLAMSHLHLFLGIENLGAAYRRLHGSYEYEHMHRDWISAQSVAHFPGYLLPANTESVESLEVFSIRVK